MRVPEWIHTVLADYEARTAPFNEVQIADSLRAARNGQGDLSDPDWAAFLAEWSAFLFIECRNRESVWDTYFAPMMTATRHDGTEVCSPDIKALNAETVAHWEERARSVANPVMKARYADLVWDLAAAISGKKPSPEYAKIAIDAYLEAADRRFYPIEIEGVQWLQRAFDLCLSIGDKDRRERVVDFMFVFYERIAAPQRIGTWIFLFDTLYPKRDVLTAEQQQRIIQHLEAMLRSTSNRSVPEHFDPFGAEAAAERLAQHYERQQDRGEVQRVIRAYGQAFEEISKDANPLLATAWLQPVVERFQQVGLRADAERVQNLSAEKGKNIADDMKQVAVSIELKQEEFDAAINSLTDGDLKSALLRIAGYFIPKVDDARAFLERARQETPLLSMIPVIRIEDGRPSATAGSAEDDPEGRLHMQLAETIRFYQLFLGPALDKLKERYNPAAEDILNLLYESPLFAETRRELLREGLVAYQDGDFVKAIHVLVPQIEHTMRHFLSLLGIPTTKPVRGQTGIMDAKSLNDALIDERVRTTLTENLWRYLFVLYVDRRGFNIRNNLAHGLISPEGFNRHIADRVLHSLLALSLVRAQQASGQTSAG